MRKKSVNVYVVISYNFRTRTTGKYWNNYPQDKLNYYVHNKLIIPNANSCRCGRDRVVIGFTTTCAISVYHH